MKVLFNNLSEFYSENVKLVKTLMKRESEKEYPELMKWKLQMLYFNENEWVEICRIDNYPHENQHGSHIHVYNKNEVKRIKITFENAEREIKKISAIILREKFNEKTEFD